MIKLVNKDAYALINSIDTKLEKDFLYYIINLIDLFKPDKLGYVQLSSTYLKQRKWDYVDYINFLLNFDILECNYSYKVGVRAKGYKFNITKIKPMTTQSVDIASKYFKPLTDKHTLKSTTKPKINYNKTITTLYSNADYTEYSNYITTILNTTTVNPKIQTIFKSTTLKRKFGTQWLKSISLPIQQIINKNNECSFSTSNRLINTFSRMPSFLRYYITIDGEDLVELDIKNSQLFFLNVLINRIDKTLIKHNDVEYFQQLCLTGRIYENILGVYHRMHPKHKDVVNRSVIKRTVLDMFFSKDIDKNGNETNFRRNTREVFKSQFPTIYKFICDYKYNNYKQLSIDLQKIESEFIFELINQKLTILPVYDCVYVKTSDVYETLSMLDYIFFNNYGMLPTFNRNDTSIPTISEIVKTKETKENTKSTLKNIWL